MNERNGRPTAYIVTIRRNPDAAPEGYYILGTDPAQAKARALRLARANNVEILSILAG